MQIIDKIKNIKNILIGSVVIVICIGIVLIIIVAVNSSSDTTNKSLLETPKTETTELVEAGLSRTDETGKTEPKQITNPDYLKDPSAYLVDDKYIIDDTKEIHNVAYVWVEDTDGPTGISVSYTIQKEGRKILKLEHISLFAIGSIDGFIGTPSYELLKNAGKSTLQCWKDGATEFLRSNFLHKKIASSSLYPYSFLVEDSSGNFTTDVSATIVSNGYGVPSVSKSLLDEDERRGGGFYGGEKEIAYKRHLLDLAGIAALEKRGLWNKCK